jgi:histidinol-phosphatase
MESTLKLTSHCGGPVPNANVKAVEERAMTARWAALRAGALVWDYFTKGVACDFKEDRTPVTIADKNAEELIRDHITKNHAGDGFLGEEHGEEPSRTGFRWIIDPIDATANFVRGIPLFGVLVGLEFEGELVAGVVHHPCFQKLYSAVQGRGAFCNDRPIRVSDVTAYAEGQFFYSSLRFVEKAGVTAEFLQLEKRFPRSRGFGDYFGFLLIAEGCGEIMVDPMVAPWDVAALKPIIEEAGGVFTDWMGVPTIYGQGAVAANRHFHREFMKAVHQKETR